MGAAEGRMTPFNYRNFSSNYPTKLVRIDRNSLRWD